MRIKKLINNIEMPKKSHLPDVGLDFFLPQDFEIESLETKTIGLGFSVSIPEGFAGMLVPRSSISQTGLIIQTAVIDPDYEGEIHLICTNASKEKLSFKKGQRLCSLVVYNVLNVRLDTEDIVYRHLNGLGSTGK